MHAEVNKNKLHDAQGYDAEELTLDPNIEGPATGDDENIASNNKEKEDVGEEVNLSINGRRVIPPNKWSNTRKRGTTTYLTRCGCSLCNFLLENYPSYQHYLHIDNTSRPLNDIRDDQEDEGSVHPSSNNISKQDILKLLADHREKVDINKKKAKTHNSPESRLTLESVIKNQEDDKKESDHGDQEVGGVAPIHIIKEEDDIDTCGNGNDKKNQFTCKECGFEFGDFRGLEGHAASHARERKRVDQLDHQSGGGSDPEALNNKMKNMEAAEVVVVDDKTGTGGSLINIKEFQCDECPRIFSTMRGLSVHKSHHCPVDLSMYNNSRIRSKFSTSAAKSSTKKNELGAERADHKQRLGTTVDPIIRSIKK